MTEAKHTPLSRVYTLKTSAEPSIRRCSCAQLAPVRAALDAVWPSYYGPNEAFWAHEYEKHGSCAEDVFPTQLDYFNSTLSLHLSHNLEVRMTITRLVPQKNV